MTKQKNKTNEECYVCKKKFPPIGTLTIIF